MMKKEPTIERTDTALSVVVMARNCSAVNAMMMGPGMTTEENGPHERNG
jgi:hypothetical protein